MTQTARFSTGVPTRLWTLCFAGLAMVVSISGCATGGAGASQAALATEEVMVPSIEPAP